MRMMKTKLVDAQYLALLGEKTTLSKKEKTRRQLKLNERRSRVSQQKDSRKKTIKYDFMKLINAPH